MESGLPVVNNTFYDTLGDRWFSDDSHPVALLRAEGKIKLAYVQDVLARRNTALDAKVLDIGCGAGIIAKPLAEQGYQVTGIDLAKGAIETAQKSHKHVARLNYLVADAYQLPFADQQFDAVLMLDFLEHIGDADRAIKEAARVLRPGGTFIFHTFNRTWIANLLVIKAVEVFTRGCPEHMHVYHLFRSPKEVSESAKKFGLSVKEIKGVRPKFGTRAFWLSLFRRRLHPDFAFTFVKSDQVGYVGYATLSSSSTSPQ